MLISHTNKSYNNNLRVHISHVYKSSACWYLTHISHTTTISVYISYICDTTSISVSFFFLLLEFLTTGWYVEWCVCIWGAATATYDVQQQLCVSMYMYLCIYIYICFVWCVLDCVLDDVFTFDVQQQRHLTCNNNNVYVSTYVYIYIYMHTYI